MIKYAIFDLDGTLLDSSEMWMDLGARYLSLLGKTPEEGLSERLSLLSLPESAEYLRGTYKIPRSSEEIIHQITKMTERFYLEEVKLKKGALELLRVLRAHSVKMSIATAGDCTLGMAALKRLGAADCFAGAVGCNEFGPKTSPEVFLAAAELIGAVPSETAVFEDSLHAVLTAKKAGFFTAAVWDIGEKNQRELKNFANAYAESLEIFANNISDLLNRD